LVVSDVDGTLVKHDRTLAASTIAAAQRLRAAGVRFALISSRPAHGMDVLLAPLGIDTPRAGFNGGEILDPTDRLVRQRTIPPDACRRAVALLEAAGTDVWVFTGGEWLLRNLDAAYIPREQLSIGMPWRVVDDFVPHLCNVHKVMGTSTDFALMGRMEEELRARVRGAASVHRSQDYYLDITHPEANKGDAALALAALLGVDPREMACLGDMPNDLPMFEASGFAIAMGNAQASVQQRADVVTANNDSDGWALAIERFVLPYAAA
jgi:Cof subfamily protein (haloacid dehalogenase superfamily)